MKADIDIQWTHTLLDINSSPGEIAGFHIYDMRDTTTFVADVTNPNATQHTLVDYLDHQVDGFGSFSFGVKAYNRRGESLNMAVGTGNFTDTLAVPADAGGVAVAIIPK